MMWTDGDLTRARERARAFVMGAISGDGADFSLTHGGSPGLFARCIAVFALTLVGGLDAINRSAIARRMRHDLRELFVRRRAADPLADKPLMQALTFTLSGLAALGMLADDPLEDVVRPLLPADVEAALNRFGALTGRPQSGNLAMFLAVALIHARDHLHVDTTSALDLWVRLHLDRMNRFGFWGSDAGMTHLQFQNGYHQYEIFEYLDVLNPRLSAAKAAVAALADDAGRFAPYPGGGGCFDYDAVFVLTTGTHSIDSATRRLLERTGRAILGEQAADGGFCESLAVRPRSAASIRRFGRHVASAWGSRALFQERLRYAVTLQRPKHDDIRTHWTPEARGWNESDLWDTWFRMLTLARIDVAFDDQRRSRWGFLPHAGLGHHAQGVAATHA